MAEDDKSRRRHNSRRSFQPLEKGYVPIQRRGYTATREDNEKLPKVPKGGTGESPSALTTSSSSAAKSEADS